MSIRGPGANLKDRSGRLARAGASRAGLRRLCLWALPLLVSTLSATSTVGTPASGFSFASAMRSAAQARGVPVPLIEAVAYVNSRWAVIPEPASDGGLGPMHILPSQIDQAARLSGHSVGQLSTDPIANLDGGAALLAQAHTGAPDLASWRPAVITVQGPYASTQVYEALQSGESRTTSGGELITLDPQVLGTAAVGAAGTTPSGAGQALAGAAVTASTASSDYPPAAWVPASPSNYSTDDRPIGDPISMIIIHDTEGSYGSAIQEFQNPAAQASAHYVVSDLGQVTQMVAEHDIAWHAGNWDYNVKSIGIEHEGYAYQQGWYTTAMYQASAKLSASICSRYGVPLDRQHVIGHSEVPDPYNPGLFGGAGHHTDPGPYWDWTYYMAQAQGYAAALPSPPRMMGMMSATGGGGTVNLYWPAAQSCRIPIDGYDLVGQPGNHVQHLAAAAVSTTFSGLDSSTVYTFTLTAHNSEATASMTTVAKIWSASYDVSHVPANWVMGKSQTFPVTVTNNGNQTWPSTGLNEVDLDLHFASYAGGSGAQQYWLSSKAFSLPSDVTPGQSVPVTVTLAPPGTGQIVLEAEVIKEQQFWFDQYAPVTVYVAPAIWSASYDVSHVPTNWVMGQSQTFPVTVTNTGDLTWPSTGFTEVDLDLHFASYAGGSGAQQYWLSSKAFSLPSDVAPGQSVTVTVAWTSPGTGQIVLEAEMIKEQQFWFAQFAPVTVVVAPPIWSASYDVSHLPTRWVMGQSQTFPVTVTNTGNQAWPSTGFTEVDLDLHFASYAGGSGALQYWLSSKAFSLPSDVAPGQSVPVTVTWAPPGTGQIVLEAEMIKEQQFWFAQYAPVTVYVAAN